MTNETEVRLSYREIMGGLFILLLKRMDLWSFETAAGDYEQNRGN